MATKSKMFLVERDGAVVTWKYYNPPQNLLNPSMGAEFGGLLNDFYNDPELRVGVFASAIPGVFIQHYDVAQLVKDGTALTKKKPEKKSDAPPYRRINFRQDSKPIIAAINAPVAGGGLELCMSFDFRFMARTCSMSQGEVGVGILPGGGGTQRMPRLIGMGRALELMLTGRAVYADEAERIGLITRACDPMQLLPDVMAFAQRLATMPPLAVHHIRKCVYEGMEMNIDDGLAMESELMAELMASDEALERMSAYAATGQKSQGQIIEEQKQELERQMAEKQD
ncbi:MAG: enoyl-CoA hydratase/isomerase family protein [Desulfobacterales bacterium]